MLPNLAAIAAELRTLADPSELGMDDALPFQLHGFDTVTSTNDVLWDLLRQGAVEGAVAIAICQERGRGQWGRSWQSPPGGLYLSLALTPDLAVDQSAQLNLCITWGITAALRQQDVPVQIKWPNDLVIGNRKVAGILIETRMHHQRITQAVVGVGMNWSNSVPETGIALQPWITQQPIPTLNSFETLAAVTLLGAMRGYQLWQQQGIDALLPSYQTWLARLGAPIVVQGQTGRIVGVSPQGTLAVELCHPDTEESTQAQFQPGSISLGYE